MTMSLYEIHMLKNYPPTNLNRDDSGAPKTCLFAGTNRGRVSSQCLKRTWRTSEIFVEAVGEQNLGLRTREMPEIVCQRLQDDGIAPDWTQALTQALTGLTGKENTKGNNTLQIAFYSKSDLNAITSAAKKVLATCESAKDVQQVTTADISREMKNVRTRPITVDIALFGRMVTSDAFADVEASMQVAHAISTNKVMVETDFFTAVDDLLTGDPLAQKGSGMMGDTDYDSSCYYLYASIDSDALLNNLANTNERADLVRAVIPALVRTMALTNPSGKQNSFAGHVLPSAILVERKDQKIPVSLVNAFADPARPGADGDLIRSSIVKLRDELDSTVHSYAIPTAQRWWFVSDTHADLKPACESTVCETFNELIEGITESLGK